MISKEGKYGNFKVAVYCTVHDINRMADSTWLENSFKVLSKSIPIAKVYLETLGGGTVVDKGLMLKVKSFFKDKGVETSGAMATSGGGSRSLCYSKPSDRKMLEDVVKYTAEVFDEIIFDDWLFTSCKCEACVEAKGDRSWTEHRLKTMEDVAENVIVKTAKAVNPKVNLIIKYPNWYEHYQFLGYSLDFESRLFDMIYTGTETRDAEYTHQHLQEYQSYAIMRFLENVKPGRNGGGWVDPLARRYLDRFSEQIRLTLFAKAKEVTLFCYSLLLEPLKQNGTSIPASTIAPVVGRVFEDMDSLIGKLGQPYGVKSYKPFNSSGEDFLHNYIGMLGIPIEITPRFPESNETVFLTECAKFDNAIIDKTKKHLVNGGNVIITSGFVKAMQNEVIREFAEVTYTGGKIITKDFSLGMFVFGDVYHSDVEIVIPHLKYPTNDVWELITCLSRGNGYPLLMSMNYGRGVLYILTIPDNFNDLYHLPPEVLNGVRKAFSKNLKAYLEGPSRVCIFLYDNDTLILHSFLQHACEARVAVKGKGLKMRELTSTYGFGSFRMKEVIDGFEREGETVFHVYLQPYSYRAFKVE
ncbi:MAG: permease [Thermoproteota archaeon]